MESNSQSFRPYAGMTCTGTEIFKGPDGGLSIIDRGRVKPFSQAPISVIEKLRSQISLDIEAQNVLREMHPWDASNRIEQFAWCRYGGLDFKPDIKDGEFQEGEFHSCPNRGKCKGEGILCKLPVFGGRRLTGKMVVLMQHLSGTDTNEVIAEKMDMAMGSFHLLKKKLYEALGGIQTKQEVVHIARDLNIV
ncbi:hypothetical protein [Altibacter sp. HG106]|uniref:hypothetical protein n=1 Tax=Altibacter sp. HG106 TaxID=3023937 RepID=UPI002350CF3F|nr:hypothetical protein [Altibacter sp. HG106]MDC7994434.1 hypothetical protein [Altibacter sp. HG106]